MNRKIGSLGETVARVFLEKKGYKFVESCWNCRYSEVDLIMKDGCTTVFIEVKTTSMKSFIQPETHFNKKKIHKLLLAIKIYLAKKPLKDYRLDLIAIRYSPKVYKVEHYVNVLSVI